MSVGSTAAALAALLVLSPGVPAPAAATTASTTAPTPASTPASPAPSNSLKPDPRAARRQLLRAAEVHEAAGHLAHALASLRALLADPGDLGPRQRADLQARVVALRKKIGVIRLRAAVDEGDAPPIAVSLRRADDTPAVDRTLEPGASIELELDPGDWLVRAEAPGLVPLEKTLAVARPAPRAREPAVQDEALTLARDRRELALQLGPAAAITAGLTLTLRADPDVQELPERREQVIEGAAADQRLTLAPGRWYVTIAAPGFRAREAVWDVDVADPGAIALEPVPLAAPPPKPPPQRPAPDLRLGLGLGLGLPGGLAFGTGIGTVVRYRQIVPRFVPAPNNAGYVRALQTTEVGAGLIGGGLGLGATALTAGLGARDRALWIELAVGGVLASAGAAWYATEWQRVQKMLYDGGKADSVIDILPVRREIAAASILGAGVGLVVGSGVALLTRALVARRAAPRLGVGPAGLFARF